MRICELTPLQLNQLEYDARSSVDPRWESLSGPISRRQHQCLRSRGYVIGASDEVLRIDSEGKLRECKNGLPCHHRCVGLETGCTQRDLPICGVADGMCLRTGVNCKGHQCEGSE